jgi:uncharacterized protein (DUF4415 family)
MEADWKAAIRFEENLRGSAAGWRRRDLDPEDAVGGSKDPLDEGRSLREEVAYARLVSELERMQVWWDRAKARPGVIPRDASGVAATAEGRRSKLTLKLDAEVVKWFRAMGLGYQARMNDVLRNWMLSVVTREIDPAEAWRKRR